MKIIEYIKENWYSLLILAITVAVSGFISIIGIKMIPIKSTEQFVHDTIFVDRTATDSLLRNISDQVREINRKIPVKRTPVRHKVHKCDTVKVDAIIHLKTQ